MAAAKKPASRSIADALIAKAKTSRETRLPPSIRAELEKLLEHNDAAPRSQRVSADDVVAMLADLGHPMCRHKFDRIVVAEFGRRWGTK